MRRSLISWFLYLAPGEIVGACRRRVGRTRGPLSLRIWHALHRVRGVIISARAACAVCIARYAR
jgi:hypothetical protein